MFQRFLLHGFTIGSSSLLVTVKFRYHRLVFVLCQTGNHKFRRAREKHRERKKGKQCFDNWERYIEFNDLCTSKLFLRYVI